MQIMKPKNLIAFFCSLALLSAFAHASSLDDGLQAYYQKDWSRAMSLFKQSIKDDPKDSLALAYYTVAHFWVGTSERQIRELEEQLVDDPADQLAEIRLGFSYYTQARVHGHKPDKALTELRQAARLGRSSLVHTGLGIVYFDMGNLTRAKKELAHAMDMNPNDLLAYEYMGQILLKFDDDPQSALNYFQEEIRRVPAYPDAHYYLGLSLDALGKQDEAEAEYAKAIRLDPMGVGRGAEARVALGDLYLKAKRTEEARQAYEEALKLDPSNGLLKKRLADLEKESKTQKP